MEDFPFCMPNEIEMATLINFNLANLLWATSVKLISTLSVHSTASSDIFETNSVLMSTELVKVEILI